MFQQTLVRVFRDVWIYFKTQIRKIGVNIWPKNGKTQNLIGGASRQKRALIGLNYELALYSF
jgi:hypothetical protein